MDMWEVSVLTVAAMPFALVSGAIILAGALIARALKGSKSA